jgi:putative glycosyltransferase (TIGR04348 family)
MRIGIITPAPPRSLHGNRRTALRWAKLLRQLGHRILIAENYAGQPCDVLIALHAKRSFDSIRKFHRRYPNKPLIVALTGTDLYRDLHRSRRAQTSLELASRLVVLQPKALDDLPPRLHPKTRVIYQSVELPRNPQSAIHNPQFRACVIGHLRDVKDPFRAAKAARLLPKRSQVEIVHVGAAMDERMAVVAEREMHANPRYRWLGELPPERVRKILLSSDVCVHSSKMEGGANAVSEAIVAGIPVLASRIPGNVGLLGEDYPGYFEVGDTRGLAKLLWQAETDATFMARLKACCRGLALNFSPQRERQAWFDLLAEF